VSWTSLAAISLHQIAAVVDAGSAGESVTTVLSIVVGSLNLGLAGIVIYWFFSGKLHSDDEMDRVTTAHSSEMDRVVTAHAVVVERLTAENQRLINEKARVEDQRDDALKLAQSQVPILQNFTAVTSNLLPILTELTRYREDYPPPRRRGRDTQ
jgi:hypothetical protein